MARYLVSFDIPDDATRKEIAELLQEYGLRVQRSVFEIDCPGKARLERLLRSIKRLIDPEADSVRFYPLCASCASKAFEVGNFPPPFDRNGVYYY